MRALIANPSLTVIVRPDRVIAAVEPRYRLPRLPWYVPASAVAGYPAPAPSPVRPEPAGLYGGGPGDALITNVPT